MRKFVVAGIQRSGTTFVTTSLDSHPGILCAGELFKMQRPKGAVEVQDSGYRNYLESKFRLRLADRILRGRTVRAFLDGFFARAGLDAIGFKLMNNQTYRGHFPMVVPYLIERQVSVIHVVRKNIFKTHLSRLLAQHRRIFHATQRPAMLPRITVPVDDLMRKLSRIEEQGKRLKGLFDGHVPYLAYTYEDFVSDPQAAGGRMQAFLDVPLMALRSPLVKIGSDDLSEIVDNLDEVRCCLKGTAYEEWVA